MKIVGLNFSKSQKYLLRIQYTFVQNEKYKTFPRNNPKGWEVPKILRNKN